MVFSILTSLLDRLDAAIPCETGVIPWGAPVLSFGDISRSRVATLGLNPSNREFVDADGNELVGRHQRFHTLRSLRLQAWDQADSRHLRLIAESCRKYFHGNPFDAWFRKLDRVISGTGASYYSSTAPACHLDLVPFATTHKWTGLSQLQRMNLLSLSSDTFARLLENSPVEVLVLNGRSVVEHFQSLTSGALHASLMPEWDLPRTPGPPVRGIAYLGTIDTIRDFPLEKSIRVVGYNHNIQSSFGVTKQAVESISAWVTAATQGVR
jgi:hypothetical protein